MNTLPDDNIDRIMRFNSHPCADMMTDLYQPYKDAIRIQKTSPDPQFRKAPRPTFFEWKVHGIGCEQWANVFEARARMMRRWDPLDALENHVNGNGQILRTVELWCDERVSLRFLEYHD